MRTVSREQVATSEVASELALPPGVQEALGQLVGSAKEGLLALSVGVGLGVLARADGRGSRRCGRREGQARPGADRGAARPAGGRGDARRPSVGVERPRVRSADGRSEIRLQTYEYFADRDPLTRSVLERMLAGVSTRRYRRTQEPVGSEVERTARSTSKSAVSRTFIERTRGALSELMSRRLDDVRLR